MAKAGSWIKKGNDFYGEHASNGRSTEYPDATLFPSEHRAIIKAKQLTSGQSLWGMDCEVWKDYGLDTQTLLGYAENGHYTRYQY